MRGNGLLEEGAIMKYIGAFAKGFKSFAKRGSSRENLESSFSVQFSWMGDWLEPGWGATHRRYVALEEEIEIDGGVDHLRVDFRA